MSLRNILVSLFTVISLLVCGLVAQRIWSSYQTYIVSQKVVQLAALDKELFNALMNFRNERGNSISALKMSAKENADVLKTAKSDRAAVEAAMRDAAAITSAMSEPSLTATLTKLDQASKQVIELRQNVDADLNKDVDKRDTKNVDALTTVGQAFLSALEDASNAIEGRLRELEPTHMAMSQLRATAWSTRAFAGGGGLIINTTLASKEVLSPENAAKLAVLDEKAAYSWSLVKLLVDHPSTSDELKASFAKADTLYFRGSFQDRRKALVNGLVAKTELKETVDGWRALQAEALLSVANLAAQAVDRISQDAVSNQGLALQNLIAMSVLFVLVLLLSAFGINMILRRVARPIDAMTKAMHALAQGDLTVDIPAVGRKDEIGAMAQSVQIFREAAIRNVALEAAADAQRLAQAQEREQLQRAAEAEAEQRLVEATSTLAAALRRLAEGDLVSEINQPMSAQFEPLRADFNQSVRELRQVLKSVDAASNVVLQGSSEISAASDNLSKRTEQQAASLEETAAALEQVTVNVQSTSKRAANARDLVKDTYKRAEGSGQVVAQAVEAMGKIEQASLGIGQIIGVIDEIAFQTNLLALNAGVEAARAGDAGKGFAVVAQEVRELAQRSANAAKEIKTLIQRSEAAVGEGVKLVNETGDGLQAIGQMVSSMNEHMDAIATAAREQSTGLAEINSSVNHLDQATQQNAAMVEQMNAAGQGLAQENEALARLLQQFKLGGEPGRSDHRTTSQRASSPLSQPKRAYASR